MLCMVVGRGSWTWNHSRYKSTMKYFIKGYQLQGQRLSCKKNEVFRDHMACEVQPRRSHSKKVAFSYMYLPILKHLNVVVT